MEVIVQDSQGAHPYFNNMSLAIPRVISLLIMGLLVFPVGFLSLADNNYLKYYHNWANAVGLVAFALLTNASI